MNTSAIILTLGILSLIGLPFLGPVAWVMSNKALKAIQSGALNPNDRTVIFAGRICGIIGTVILIGVLIIYISAYIFTAKVVQPMFDHMMNSPTIATNRNPNQPASLSSAITKQDVNAVKKLLDHDPSLANKKGMTRETPIFEAVFVGNKQIVQALIDHGPTLTPPIASASGH